MFNRTWSFYQRIFFSVHVLGMAVFMLVSEFFEALQTWTRSLFIVLDKLFLTIYLIVDTIKIAKGLERELSLKTKPYQKKSECQQKCKN